MTHDKISHNVTEDEVLRVLDALREIIDEKYKEDDNERLELTDRVNWLEDLWGVSH